MAKRTVRFVLDEELLDDLRTWHEGAGGETDVTTRLAREVAGQLFGKPQGWDIPAAPRTAEEMDW